MPSHPSQFGFLRQLVRIQRRLFRACEWIFMGTIGVLGLLALSFFAFPRLFDDRMMAAVMLVCGAGCFGFEFLSFAFTAILAGIAVTSRKKRLGETLAVFVWNVLLALLWLAGFVACVEMLIGG